MSKSYNKWRGTRNRLKRECYKAFMRCLNQGFSKDSVHAYKKAVDRAEKHWKSAPQNWQDREAPRSLIYN